MPFYTAGSPLPTYRLGRNDPLPIARHSANRIAWLQPIEARFGERARGRTIYRQGLAWPRAMPGGEALRDKTHPLNGLLLRRATAYSVSAELGSKLGPELGFVVCAAEPADWEKGNR